RILQMMRQGCRRIFRSGRAMHERRWTQRRFSRITKVGKPRGAFADRMGILRRQLHEKIMRMLPVNNRLALIGLARLKQQRRPTRWKRKRLNTEHAAELHGASPQLVKGHWHQ